MKNLTIKQLRYFDALCRHGHFGHAASDCAISQPALSMQIKELEANVGAPLIERSSKGIILTGLGEAFATRARTILRQVDELGDLARAAEGDMAGPLRLGVIPTIAPYLLPGVIRLLSRDHPGLDVRVRETLTPRLLEELGEGRLDAAILALPVSEPTLLEVPLWHEDFVLVRPKAEAGHPVPGPDGLAQMRLLLLEEGHCFRDQALSFCDARGGRPRELLDASSLSTLVQMVGGGMGVTLVPRMAVKVETAGAAVAVQGFGGVGPSRSIGMVWRRSSPLGPKLSQVADIVRTAGQPETVRA